jgi:NADH-quinone oxidoreductase subunit E
MTVVNLAPELCAKIDAWIERYPPEHKASGIMQALLYAQEANDGYLSPPLLAAVADYLAMPHSLVYEIATFYSLYNLQPVGKNIIAVCNNISCSLCGAAAILEHLEQRLNIKAGENTADGKFSLRTVECLGACIGAPIMQINNTYYENLTPDTVDAILAQF